MNKTDKRTICLLLGAIILFSIILILKIKNENKYDKHIYSEIYQEYEEVFGEMDNKPVEEAPKKKEEKEENKYYKVIGCITIPKLGKSYPVIAQTTEEYLKVAPCKFWGGEPNQQGNLSIIGHNYKNSEFFSQINTLEIGDNVSLQDKTGETLIYKVFDKFEVSNNDFACTEQSTNGTIDLTLITCTNSKSKRYVVKCRANI